MRKLILIITALNMAFAADLRLDIKQCMQLYYFQKFLEYARDNNIKKEDINYKIISDVTITNKLFLLDEVTLIYNLPKYSKYSKGTLRQCEKGGIIFREV